MSTAQDMKILEFEELVFEKAVPVGHAYRKLLRLIDFEELASPLSGLYSNLGQHGIPVVKGLKAMLLQFWEDYSDRQMERAVCENLAIRWFVGFSLQEKTPDHTYFCKLRKRIGTKRIANIFNFVNEELRKRGMFGNIFHFIDASTIISKSALWEERDKAIKDGHDKLNNIIVKDYAADSEARWGAKSKRNIWFGYKRHTTVGMRFGLISKTTVTPANVPDFRVVNKICPTQGYIFSDKLYDTKKTDQVIIASGCSPGTIRKNNNPVKNFDLDRWKSAIRMPFEGTFSKFRKRTRYKSLNKVTFEVFLQSTVFNLKKAVQILPLPSYI